jgi:hypothetical protein
MKDLRIHAPATAWAFLLACLAPFAVAAGLFCYGSPALAPSALMALLSYSAIMLAFIGGLRCGFEITETPRWRTIGLAMIAVLIAMALIAAPIPADWRLGGFLTAFLVQWAWDMYTFAHDDHDGDHELPTWRPRMRTLLTLGAVLALSFALEQALRM